MGAEKCGRGLAFRVTAPVVIDACEILCGHGLQREALGNLSPVTSHLSPAPLLAPGSYKRSLSQSAGPG
jgi:hypothetical protein